MDATMNDLPGSVAPKEYDLICCPAVPEMPLSR
jgi:hypothetical protein